MKVLAFSAILLAVLALVQAQTYDPSCYPCDPNWPRPLYYPNYEDCSTVYECNQGQVTLTACEPGLVFEFLLQACVQDSPQMLYTCRKLTGLDC